MDPAAQIRLDTIHFGGGKKDLVQDFLCLPGRFLQGADVLKAAGLEHPLLFGGAAEGQQPAIAIPLTEAGDVLLFPGKEGRAEAHHPVLRGGHAGDLGGQGSGHHRSNFLRDLQAGQPLLQ